METKSFGNISQFLKNTVSLVLINKKAKFNNPNYFENGDKNAGENTSKHATLTEFNNVDPPHVEINISDECIINQRLVAFVIIHR